MNRKPQSPAAFQLSIFEPLRVPFYRRMWLASLLSNSGMLIQGVGAAWAMTQLTPRMGMVAGVQTALFLPTMLLALPAGAIADTYDRRKVGIASFLMSLVSAAALTGITLAGLLTPWTLLGFCFLIGSGSALFGPAWQASVREQVPEAVMPQAVALNSISFNLARSFGPAIGGIIVAVMGSVAAFAINAVAYLPLLVVLLLWRYQPVPPQFPPEGFARATSVGLRYIGNSPAVRVILLRTVMTCFAGSSLSALMPITARDLLGGGAETFGIILGSFGAGGVFGALNIAVLRARMKDDQALLLCLEGMSGAAAVVAWSPWLPLTAIALMLVGAFYMIALTLYNVSIQMLVPRWVAGRTLAALQASVAGGIALGSWTWGQVAQQFDVSIALSASAIAMGATLLTDRMLSMPKIEDRERESVAVEDPEVAMPLSHRSGPIAIEIVYKVDVAQVLAFVTTIRELQRVRQRNGAYGWTIGRDLATPTLWTERFCCPTWLDYLRLRSRSTTAELSLQRAAHGFHDGDSVVVVRRLLERPYGSGEWLESAPDLDLGDVQPANAEVGETPPLHRQTNAKDNSAGPR